MGHLRSHCFCDYLHFVDLILKTLEEVACYFGAGVEGVDALKKLNFAV